MKTLEQIYLIRSLYYREFLRWLCGLLNIRSTKYRWINSFYDPIISIFVGLTNVHNKQTQLRADYNNKFNRVNKKSHEISDESCEKRKLTQGRYMERRKRLMNKK